MNKAVWSSTKINFRTIKAAYIVTFIVLLAMLVQDIVKMCLISNGVDMSHGVSTNWENSLYILVALSAILIPARNYKRIMGLGGSRADFLKGSILNYIILAALVSLVNIIVYYTYDVFVAGAFGFSGELNLLNVFGWAANGPAVAFLQQFAFLFGLACFLHTFTTMQGTKWGLAADIAIVAIISVFTPIEPLRQAEIWFFNLIIFQPNAVVQMLACLIMGSLVYLLNKPLLGIKQQ